MAGRKKVLLKVGFLNFKPRCIHKNYEEYNSVC